ncbi:hypothetical protein IWW36_004630, partial [Coemansia brasiliensis]
SRVPLMIKGMTPALYGPALALFLRQTAAPQVNLLAHTNLGVTRRKPSHGVQTWIHDAVSSVFGHASTVDVLMVIDRVLGAFAAPELRAILEAIERCHPDARRAAGPIAPAESLAQLTPTRQPSAPERKPLDAQVFESQVAAAQRFIAPYVREVAAARSGSPMLDFALSRPPKRMVFGPNRSLLLADCVRALHGAEVLAERQLRLLAPESSADQARSLVADIFLVLHRLFSASDGAGSWGGSSSSTGGSGESARSRVQSLHEAQTSIRVLYGRLRVVFGASRGEIEAIKQAQDDAAISAQGGLQPFGNSSGFGQRLAARGRPSDVATPEMQHGALTPRGRWELKTGRKKFTTQSLLSSSPPQWRLQESPSSDAGAILPRGPRAQLQARSYESQWLLDRIRFFNVWANRYFQKALNVVDAHVFPVPSELRAYQLDFRWAAAYPNIRFALVVLLTGGPEVLQLKTIPRPTAGPGEIVVRNHYAGVNFIDTYFRSGVYPSKLPGQLGQEGAGQVYEVGPHVTGFQKGDQVVYLGNQDTYAQYSVTKASRAVKLANTSMEQAVALLVQGLTAHTLVTRSYKVEKGDWVLVQAGAGGTGRLLVQMCKQMGAHVIATTSTEAKAQVAKSAGADYIINYQEEDVAESVRKLVSEGVHVVFDGVGKATFAGSLKSLRREGSMVSFGNASGVVPPVNLLDLSAQNIKLLRPRLYGYIVEDDEFKLHLHAVLRMLEQGELDVHVHKIYELKDAGMAHVDLQSRKTTGKLLISIP